MQSKPVTIVEVGENNTPLPNTAINCPDLPHAQALVLQKAAAGKHYIILTNNGDQLS